MPLCTPIFQGSEQYMDQLCIIAQEGNNEHIDMRRNMIDIIETLWPDCAGTLQKTEDQLRTMKDFTYCNNMCDNMLDIKQRRLPLLCVKALIRQRKETPSDWEFRDHPSTPSEQANDRYLQFRSPYIEPNEDFRMDAMPAVPKRAHVFSYNHVTPRSTYKDLKDMMNTSRDQEIDNLTNEIERVHIDERKKEINAGEAAAVKLAAKIREELGEEMKTLTRTLLASEIKKLSNSGNSDREMDHSTYPTPGRQAVERWMVTEPTSIQSMAERHNSFAAIANNVINESAPIAQERTKPGIDPPNDPPSSGGSSH
jgi:hypothetical protein